MCVPHLVAHFSTQTLPGTQAAGLGTRPVRGFKVSNCSALGQELRVAEDLKADGGVCTASLEHLHALPALDVTLQAHSTRAGQAGSWTPPLESHGRAELAPGGLGRVSRTFSMASAVFTGTVDFSTTILEEVDTLAIMRAAFSQ